MERLLSIMRRLRAPDGCPWDREQTHRSLRPYLLEEACEAIDAITVGDSAAMIEELGDVLLQVAFHAVIAEESGQFGYQAIETSIVEKLIRRHPHVFAEVRVTGADEVIRNWQAIKATEKTRSEPLEQVPRSLPALMRAAELGRALAWPTPTRDELLETLTASLSDAETETNQAVGDALLALVDYARAVGANPELALREALDARSQEDA